MRAFNFEEFCINEGASIKGSDGMVTLDYNNNSSDQKEVLKTTKKSSHYKYYPEVDLPNSKKFEVRWGLDYDSYKGVIDHEGRFKYTMDQLKNGNIINRDASLSDFLKKSYDDLGISEFRPDYIVAVGSTAGLVASLVNVTRNLFRKSETFNSPKIEYANIGTAIDWDELYRQKGGAHAYRFLSELLSKHAKNTNKLKKQLKGINSFGELREFFERELPNVQWKEEGSDGKSLIPFKVRSSGVWSRDGFRDFLKPKYDTISNEFQNIILECISEGKKMLIIDDNRNTDTDIKTICRDIDNVAKLLGVTDLQYRSNFKFYLLYSMSDRGISDEFIWKTSDIGKTHSVIRKDSIAASDFETFLQTGEAGEKFKTLDKKRSESELKTKNLIQEVRDIYKFFYPTIKNPILTMDKAIRLVANKNGEDFEKTKHSYYKALKVNKQHAIEEMWPYAEKYQ
jgi:hypothetical protein